MESQRTKTPPSELSALFTQVQRAPSDEELHRKCVHLLRDLYANRDPCFEAYQPQVCNLLELLFRGEMVDHERLTHFAIKQLKLKYHIDAGSDPAKEGNLLFCLAEDFLFLTTLEKTLNVDNEFEGFLRKLRRFLLFEYRARQHLPEALLRLTAALAQQCFNNEFIFNEDEDESRVAHDIGQTLGQGFQSDAASAKEAPLLIVGMYYPISQLPSSARLAEIPLSAYSQTARPAIIRILREPLEERRLRDGILSFGSITNQTSRAVRAQYEENPYPRWLNLGGPFQAVETKLAEMHPGFSLPFSFRDQKLQILVAGCGTGRQPLSIAAANPNADILAIDLSKSSLAYAKRMADRLQLRNVSFRHGDLLEMRQIGKHFHYIECAGVLHHMGDPVAGWRILEQILLPGGVLRIGVYSRIARLPVEFLRDEIKRLELKPTALDMKGFRRQLLTEEKYKPLVKYLHGRDFYSLSSFRDFLFHTREYGYTLIELEEIIDALRLEFLGFDLRSPSLEAKYRQQFPNDLHMNNFENWRRFERNYTGSLIGFYLILQKPIGAG